MSNINGKIPPGLHVSAVAVGDFELTGGVNGKGKAYSKVVGRGLAGSKFVKVSQFLEANEKPVIIANGEAFEGEITGVDSFEKGREVVSVFVKLRRPSLVGVEVKK